MANGVAMRPLEEIQEIIRAAGMDKGRGSPDKKVGNKGYASTATELLKISDDIPGVSVEVDRRTETLGDRAMVRVPKTSNSWSGETDWMTKRELRQYLKEEWQKQNNPQKEKQQSTGGGRRRLSAEERDELIRSAPGLMFSGS